MISLFNNIIEATLLSSILIGTVLIIRKIFSQKISIKVLTLLWIMVLARLIIPFSFETSINIGGIIPSFNPNDNITENSTLAEGAEIDNTTNTETIDSTADTAQPNVPVNNADGEYTEQTTKSISSYLGQINYKQILSFVWLASALIALSIKAKRMYIFSKKISASREIKDNQILLMLNSNKSLLRLKRKVTLYECDYIDAPLTCRVLRPKILIPVGFISNLDDNQQNMIILHELYHIKNLDVLKNYVWLAAKIIYWFNPLIKYAYKAYIEDTETSCDTMVLATYSSDQRQLYSQSLIDITKLSKGEMILPAALSFCEDKSILRKRVEYMIKPTKKLRIVSIIALLISLLFVTLCFTTACLPKTTSSFNAIILSDDTIHIEYNLNPSKNVTINVDANVMFYDSLPIISIEPKNISAKQLETFTDYVLVDTPVYYRSPYYIDSKHSHGDLFDGTIVPLGEYNKTYTELYAFTPDEKQSYLQLEQSPTNLSTSLTYWRFDDGTFWDSHAEYTGTDIAGMEKSYDECLQIAEELIKKLVGEDNKMKLCSTLSYTGGVLQPAYRFSFQKEYYGIPATEHVSSFSTDFGFGIDLHSMSMEKIYIFVDDDGLFEFHWSSQNTETDVEQENANLIKFDKINEIFIDYCNNNTEWILNGLPYEDSITSVQISITDIELNFIPLSREISYTSFYDSYEINEFQLEPVWKFNGEVIYTINDGKLEDNEATIFPELSIVSINALDGTILD